MHSHGNREESSSSGDEETPIHCMSYYLDQDYDSSPTTHRISEHARLRLKRVSENHTLLSFNLNLTIPESRLTVPAFSPKVGPSKFLGSRIPTWPLWLVRLSPPGVDQMCWRNRDTSTSPPDRIRHAAGGRPAPDAWSR